MDSKPCIASPTPCNGAGGTRQPVRADPRPASPPSRSPAAGWGSAWLPSRSPLQAFADWSQAQKCSVALAGVRQRLAAFVYLFLVPICAATRQPKTGASAPAAVHSHPGAPNDARVSYWCVFRPISESLLHSFSRNRRTSKEPARGGESTHPRADPFGSSTSSSC